MVNFVSLRLVANTAFDPLPKKRAFARFNRPSAEKENLKSNR
jgi:hypothetical protein